MKAIKVELVNPAASQLWRPRLEHLIDCHPRMVEDLFRRKILEQKLADDVNAAVTEERRLQEQGKEKDEARNLVFETMIAPSMPEIEPKPIPPMLLNRIMRWADKVEERDRAM